MNDVVGDLRDFAAHFLSRSQVKLDNFPSATLKKTDDRSVSLQGGLFLSKRAATRDRPYNSYEKKRILFHDLLVLRDHAAICQKIMRVELKACRGLPALPRLSGY
jgi:hypothetical protein